MKPCPRCGYVPGTTSGYVPLTDEEKRVLEQAGYELTKNIYDEDLARPLTGGYGFDTARKHLHKVRCSPTIWDRLLGKKDLV
jgi:hypothetical protein